MEKPENCTCDIEDWMFDNCHHHECPCYEWKYKLPCDGTDGDMLFNEKCIENDELKETIVGLRTEVKNLQLGSHTHEYHDIHCNANRREPMGCDMCSCFMYKRAQKAENKLKDIFKIVEDAVK